MPYIGKDEDIPNGWAVCDGTNGTPDLRGRFLEGGSTNDAKTFVDPGLPNIKGTLPHMANARPEISGAFIYPLQNRFVRHYLADGNRLANQPDVNLVGFDASQYNAIYGKSATVQPSAYVVRYIIRLI